MKLQKTLQGMLRMRRSAWRMLMVCLWACCLLLLINLAFLFSYEAEGAPALLRSAALCRDLSQLTLLGAVLLPACMEDLGN